jgi:serine/threonine-protein kinase RsbW
MATPDRDQKSSDPGSHLRIVIDAALHELGPASAQIRYFLRLQGVDGDAIYALETAVEELVTNAIKYAFPGGGKGSITLEARATPERALLLIEDNGNAFDPTLAPAPNVERSLEEMPIGGLGIHLIRKLTDSFVYERSNNCNRVKVWVLRKS